MEKQIEIAVKLYRAREAMKSLFRDEYPAKVHELQILIRRAMVKWNLDEIPTTMKIVEALQEQEPDSEMTQALFLAACVELIAPTEQ